MNFDDWEEESIPLETEWIQEFEKIVEERIYYPCEPMTSLCVRSLFIEKDSIIHVSTKQISLEPCCVSKGGYRNIWELLDKNSKEPYWMEWIKECSEFVGSEESLEVEKKRLEKRAKGFYLSDILLFNVDINMGSDTEGAVDNLDSLALGNCFRCYSVEGWNDLGGMLEWKDSVFLFHSINAVYFLFRENPVMAIDVDDLESGGGSVSVELPVSILVGSGGGGIGAGMGMGGGGSRKTRRVHFDYDEFDIDSSASSVSEESEEEEEEEEEEEGDGWGRGTWLKRRKRNRRKTNKRKHVFSPALIRSFFEN